MFVVSRKLSARKMFCFYFDFYQNLCIEPQTAKSWRISETKGTKQGCHYLKNVVNYHLLGIFPLLEDTYFA